MSSQSWSDKRVLITGICGTVGTRIFQQLLEREPKEIIGLDNNESELFFLEEECRQHDHVNLHLCDVRDRQNLKRRIEGVDIVLHTAALKHVMLCEKSPGDAVRTNIEGVRNVIAAAMDADVERVLFTSSDKAVNPTNVMGTSKLMGERLLTAANARQRDQDGPIFASTRFGNVLGSRGSVIPIFKQQIADGGPVTLTDPRMTRFIMTLEEAARLVLDSVFLAKGGEVFVTKMPVVRIEDLAHVMIEELGPVHGHVPESIEVDVIGAKPGEKFYEELMNNEESRRTVEIPEYFAILPAFKSLYHDIDYSYPGMDGVGIENVYNSSTEEPMSREQLRNYLHEKNLLETHQNQKQEVLS
ncbi:SDR family NAD(P)-dependent oxidoreductase [Salinibacter ruber]|uniref:SDR family NAD(P)-dependent oxidoreductase n=1 Tax=Salinibacter ruber TaxID=146919 RepID=UPI00216889D3|nr:SDR family NAD(P)-dependent oxidoreductase [Salinibacter ruber]MCS3648576.1 FlaA1/EpsC-like NDP-sugar epimerase [Salinibacter ruber]